MRVSFAVSYSVALSRALVAGETCQSYCESLEGCNEGSYCKSYQNPPVCQGLFWVDEAETEMCSYGDSKGTCPENRPVKCPRVTDVCGDICRSTPGCRTDKHGSYCKDWQTVPVCFGLYFTDAAQSSTCYAQFDRTCPTKFPVGCGSVQTWTAPSPGPTGTTPSPTATSTPTVVQTTVPVAAAVAGRVDRDPLVELNLLPETTTPPKTTTTSKAPTVPHPSGVYEGSIFKGMLSMVVKFTDRTLDIDLSAKGVSFSGSGISYLMNGDRVELVEGPALQSFLDKVPMQLTASDISITYDAAGEKVSGTFNGFTIVGTKAA